MNRIVLDLGFIQIYWYSIFILLGVIVGSVFVYREAKKQGLSTDQLVDLIFYTMIIAIIGARVYYVAFNLDYYLANPLSIFEIWNGGLAIHGGIISGFLFLVFYTKKKHIRLLKLLDILIVGLIIGQVIGRWGNFFNGEAYGAVVTKETLMKQGIPTFIINGMYIDGVYHQPTFLYESVANLIGFFLLLLLRRYKYLKTGQLTGFYLVWYAVVRFFIEGLRTDSLMLGPLRVAQLVSICLLLIGLYLLFIKYRKEPKLSHLYQKEAIYERV